MKKRFGGTVASAGMLCALSGCGVIGDKSTSMSVIYGATVVLSVLLLVGYCRMVRRREVWFLLLFSSVVVVNVGYLALATSRTLEAALWANRVSYLGSALLPLSMLMIILNTVGLRYRKWLPGALALVSGAVFLVAASPGYLEIYYKAVSLGTVNGVTVLQKEYGPWHSLYLFYLLAYFGGMIGVIAYASAKRRLQSGLHATLLTGAVAVNLGVWLLEQLVRIEFEFLSVSYIISELFLLGLCLMTQESGEPEMERTALEMELAAPEMEHCPGEAEELPQEEPPQEHQLPTLEERCRRLAAGLPGLTRTERAVYELYLEGRTTREVLAELNIKENTLKYHNKNLYSKLGVSSRKQLMEIAKALPEVMGTGKEERSE